MALATEKLGTTWSCEVEDVDADRARAYAEATNDPNPAYASGSLAPPVFGVVPTWQSMSDALTSMVPPEAFLMIVHGEQDMHFHQPLAPGQRLATAAEAFSVRVGRSGTRYTMKVLSEDTTTGTLVDEHHERDRTHFVLSDEARTFWNSPGWTAAGRPPPRRRRSGRPGTWCTGRT